ncbi:MAG TPA: hypothetical protein VJP40_04055, partial [bacterium]|nr:hypothetical protein [bacterium]
MTPPTSSTTVVDPLYAQPPAEQPVANPNPAPAPAAAPQEPSPQVTPFRLQLSGGYTSLNLGNGGPSYSGGLFQATVGQNFHVHPQHAFFLNGVFRVGGLSDGSGSEVSLVHFGA